MKKLNEDRLRGTVYGQAVGDALGLGTEFMDRATVSRCYPAVLRRYDEFVRDAFRKKWAEGAWTDDTEMAVCVLEAFHDGRFDPHEAAANFKKWFESDPLDIGTHTFKILSMRDYVSKPEDCSKMWWEVSGRSSAANGALMRTAVVGLAPEDAARQAEEICRLTHWDPRCVGSCVIVSEIVHNLVWHDRALTFEEVMEIADRYDGRIGEWVRKAYETEDVEGLELDEAHSIGYTLRTLSAALWCYWHSPDFVSGLLAVVNAGGDADTNAAVACAVLGAKYGFSSIPRYYVENLRDAATLDRLIARLTRE